VSEERLDRALQALPRPGAPAGFTEATLARLARSERRRRLVPWLAVAGAGTVGALLLALWPARTPGPAPELAGQIESLRREQRALAAELADLRALDEPAVTSAPVIYLGRSAGVELVLDLGRLEQAPRPGGEGTRP
jgi:hypothetical protein